MYVTDYTSRVELHSFSAKDSWAHGHEGQILKIKLCNGQAERISTIDAGAYYKIHNLRLKASTTERQFLGFLGGPDDLIQMLDPNSQDDQDLNSLVR